MSRLQLLTTKFENLRMNEDESIYEFHIRLSDISNTYFSLGEKMSEENLAIKVLRTLPKRFDMKVTFIKVDELIGSLQTFEMSINKWS